MRPLVICFALALATLSLGDEYKVLHRRPSTILAMMDGNLISKPRVYSIQGGITLAGGTGLVPKGVTLEADDEAGKISIDGSNDQIEEMRTLLQQFDVPVRKVMARIVVKSAADKYESTTETEIANNTQWSLSDGVTGTNLKIAVRINGDGTVTGSCGLGNDSSHTTLVMRLEQKKTAKLGLGAEGVLVIEEGGVPRRPDWKTQPIIPDGIEIFIRFEAVESKSN